jgi:hypothetical protein
MIIRFIFFFIIVLLLGSNFYSIKERSELKQLQEEMGITIQRFIEETEGNRYTLEDAKVDFTIRDEQIKLLRIEVDNIKKQINKNDN